ncbi:MAG TPA: hypothetical protein VE077_16665 [Candidatus Methylomirabilis sp.]|nr:hypothetical protein [Candidatus Methylomirabilis sp.]
MRSPISHVTQAPAAQTQTAAPQPKAAPAAKAQQLPTDTVNIRSAAQSLAAEAVESRAQTIQEAAKGDSQARRLLAKETAAQQVAKK